MDNVWRIDDKFTMGFQSISFLDAWEVRPLVQSRTSCDSLPKAAATEGSEQEEAAEAEEDATGEPWSWEIFEHNIALHLSDFRGALF